MTNKKARQRQFVALRRLVGHEAAVRLRKEYKHGTTWTEEQPPQGWPAPGTGCHYFRNWEVIQLVHERLQAKGLQVRLASSRAVAFDPEGLSHNIVGDHKAGTGERLIGEWDNGGHHSHEGLYLYIRDAAAPRQEEMVTIGGVTMTRTEYAVALRGVKAWELGRTGPMARER